VSYAPRVSIISKLTNTHIVKSLKKCGISNALDGSEDDILCEESDTSSDNNHEDDFSGSDDDFLGFCGE
jgi:hypothetical protein